VDGGVASTTVPQYLFLGQDLYFLYGLELIVGHNQTLAEETLANRFVIIHLSLNCQLACSIRD